MYEKMLNFTSYEQIVNPTQMESRMTAAEGKLVVEGQSKKDKGLMDIDNSVGIAGVGRGV